VFGRSTSPTVAASWSSSPKGDLVDGVRRRVSAERHSDIVVLDPSDPAPIGLNPLAAHGQRPELLADGVLATFKQLYPNMVQRVAGHERSSTMLDLYTRRTDNSDRILQALDELPLTSRKDDE
jgi:hypothetical protein